MATPAPNPNPNVNRFDRNDFTTVQPAAYRLARALYYRLNELHVDELEQERLLNAIDVVRRGNFDISAPIDTNSRELFVNALRRFVAAEVGAVDETDDYAYEAFVDEIRPYSALIEYYQQSAAYIR
jgi:BMFP domain-containing protein YqiC